MGLMILSCVAAIVFIVLGFSGAYADEKPAPEAKPAATTPAKEVEKGMTREEIRKKLEKLAETEAPKQLSPGAMCYKMAGPPDRAEYVCPACNEKTLYVTPKGKWDTTVKVIAWDLPTCRRLVKQIKDLKVTLIESSFCKKCQPDAKKQELGLSISYAGEANPHTISPVTPDDLSLLVDFTTGKLKHSEGQDREVALKSRMTRLKELLGTDAEKTSE